MAYDFRKIADFGMKPRKKTKKILKKIINYS